MSQTQAQDPTGQPRQTKDVTTNPFAIPNFLATSPKESLAHMRFRLGIRQEPKAARCCGFGEEDRRAIDPPPILQMFVENPSITKEEITAYLTQGQYLVIAELRGETGGTEVQVMQDHHRHRRLIGTNVAHPFFGHDEQGNAACFFTFQDLSCRTVGCYRLYFTLTMIDTRSSGPKARFGLLADAMSQCFTVHYARDFPGVEESSDLLKLLRMQGHSVPLKKGTDRAIRPIVGGPSATGGSSSVDNDVIKNEERSRSDSPPRKKKGAKSGRSR